MKTIIILLLILFGSCKKEIKTTSEINAIALMSFGEIKKGGMPFKQNDILKYEEELVFSPRSFCELQIEKEDWVFRLKGVAKFQVSRILEVDEDTGWSFKLEEGTIQAKMGRKLRTKEIFRIITPTALIGVRGTNFQVKVDSDGSTHVAVTEGQVAVQISPNVVSNSQLSNALKSKEIVLEKGKAVPINKATIEKIANLPSEKFSEIDMIFKDIELKQVTNLSQNESTKLEQDFSSLTSLPPEAFEKEETRKDAIFKRTTESSAGILKMMEEVVGAKKDTITLVSGEEVTGILEKKDKLIIMHTPFGKREFQEAQVLEVSPE